MNYILFIIINFIILILFHKSKIPRFIFLALLVSLAYSYVDLADYEGYSQMFDASKGDDSGQYFLESTEIGFRFLVFIGNYFNLKFEIFKSLVYLFCGILIVRALVRIDSKSANFVLSLYIFYPLILDLVQIRHFIAMSIFVSAFSYFLVALMKSKVKLKNFLYFLPALLFHQTFALLIVIVFISYLLIDYLDTNRLFNKNLLFFILAYLITSSYIVFSKISSSIYFTTSTSFSTVFFYSIIYLIFYLLFYFVGKRIKYLEDFNPRVYSFMFIYTTILIGSNLPLMFFNVEFFRFFRVELIIILSVLISVLLKKNKLINNFFIVLIFIIHLVLAILIFYIYYFDNLIFPLLLMGYY